MKHTKVAQLVKVAYTSSKEPFARWMWDNHLQVVAKEAEVLSQKFKADVDLAVAGAWLHDFGDAFVHRHSVEHEKITISQATEILVKAGFTGKEIQLILDKIIATHACKDGKLPQTLEGKILATADAVAHLSTDFYLQFAWKHLPEGKSYTEFVS